MKEDKGIFAQLGDCVCMKCFFVAFFIILALLATLVFYVSVPKESQNRQELEFQVGVAFCGNTTAEAGAKNRLEMLGASPTFSSSPQPGE